MSKRILFISQTPTHPQNAGNRSRIYNMVNFLISEGHDVHFLHSQQQKCDMKAMEDFWGTKLYNVPFKRPVINAGKIKKGFRLFKNKHEKYYSGIDDNYNLNLDGAIRDLLSDKKFDAVIVEYIFLSKAFNQFTDNTLKIIDTHDIMANRHKMFLRSGKEPSWFSVRPSEEKKGVNRADVIIAIQENERKYFSKISSRKVINVGHTVNIYKPQNQESPRKTLLFIGSNNPINLHGIKDFLDNHYPSIVDAVPGIKLNIAGSICSQLEKYPHVKMLGEVDEIKTAYETSDVIINPLIFGTGLKIKMIEGLGYSKAIISTEIGAHGLEEGEGTSFLMARSTEDWVNHCKDVFMNTDTYQNLIKNAPKLAEKWNSKNTIELKTLFS